VQVEVEKASKVGRKAKGDGYLRRAEILQAAEKLFVSEGYQGATIRKIAQEVGLSSTALYMHFRDKSEILVEICEHTFDHLRVTNQEIAALPLPAVEQVRRMLQAYMDFALANPNAYLVVFERTMDISDDKKETLNAMGGRVAAPLEDVLRKAAAETPLRCGAEEAAQTCWAACHGLVSLIINHPQVPWSAPTDVLRNTLLDTLINGLQAA
jgi:AcrR family transcriptional regulator